MLISGKPKIFDIDLYGLAVLLAAAVLAWLLILQPLDRESQKLQQDRLQSQQDQQTLQSEIASLQKSVQKQQIHSNRLAQHAPSLSCNMDLPDVISRIGHLASGSSLQLYEIIPGSVYPAQHFYKTNMSLRLFGSFPQLREFLAQLAHNLPLVRIKNLALARKDPDEGSCDIDMQLDVFVWKYE